MLFRSCPLWCCSDAYALLFFRSCLFLFCSDHVFFDVVQMLILCCCLNHVLSDVVQMLMPCCCSNHVLSDVVQMLMLCCCSLRSCPLWWCSDVYMPCCFFRSCLFFILFRSCPLWCCSDAHALLLFTQIMSSLMLFRCLCHAFIQIMSPKLFRWLYYYLWGCSDYQRPSRGEDKIILSVKLTVLFCFPSPRPCSSCHFCCS